MIGLTLGLAYPFAQASLERFKLHNTCYGDLQGHFVGSGMRLFFRGSCSGSSWWVRSCSA